MSYEDLISTVSKVVPALGIALGGPAGGIVGSLIANVFGGNHDNPNELAQIIQADPEAALKLKQLEYQIAQLDLEAYQTEVEDRKDSRNMQLNLHDPIPSIIACAFVIIYAFVQCFVINHPGSQNDVISARVQDIMVMIIGFYFGSMYKRRKLSE